MTHSLKRYLFLSLICIFSCTQLHSAWWFLTAQELTHPYLPSITKALDNEFERILAPSEQKEWLRTAIEQLKVERIPQILQEAEYEHASQAFINNAQLLRYSFDLVRAASLDFFAQCVHDRCTELIFRNPPCSPEFMAPEDIRQGVVNYLYDLALTALTNSKSKEPLRKFHSQVEFSNAAFNGKGLSIKELLYNLDIAIQYGIHLAIHYGS